MITPLRIVERASFCRVIMRLLSLQGENIVILCVADETRDAVATIRPDALTVALCPGGVAQTAQQRPRGSRGKIQSLT
ncbi:hypothetical protein ACMAUO_08570 [Gluconacetobacter sp. Hr-1-5]|uniref:hypothetical protein n=1 Tax=Gluconacetobacter sp. Hr-1-5 TaxID=3395370 RepID=UPI003B527BCB